MLSAPAQCKKITVLLRFIRSIYPTLSPNLKFRENTDPHFADDLAHYEQRNTPAGLKFGVLYRKTSQTDEDDMFSNTEMTPAFAEFLKLIGDRVTLQGFGGYRGGLDVRSNATGTESVYTKYEGIEVMFHVAPLLPMQPNDKQRLERKRHLGNDVVVIVFQENEDSGMPFNPNWMHSEMNHVFVVVAPARDGQSYHVSSASKRGVKKHEPLLPVCAVRNSLLRDFLLPKLINAERAALCAPVFEKKLAKTRRILLEKASAYTLAHTHRYTHRRAYTQTRAHTSTHNPHTCHLSRTYRHNAHPCAHLSSRRAEPFVSALVYNLETPILHAAI